MERTYGIRLAEAMLNEAYRAGIREHVKIYAKIGGKYREVTSIQPVFRMDGTVERYNLISGLSHHWSAYPSDLLFYVFTPWELAAQIGLEYANR